MENQTATGLLNAKKRAEAIEKSATCSMASM